MKQRKTQKAEGRERIGEVRKIRRSRGGGNKPRSGGKKRFVGGFEEAKKVGGVE